MKHGTHPCTGWAIPNGRWSPIAAPRGPRFVRWPVGLVLLSALLLAGCDNFREGVTLQPWQFESIAEPPSPDNVDGATPIGTELVTAGSGPAVKAGDLVRLRYWRTVIQADKTEQASDTAEV